MEDMAVATTALTLEQFNAQYANQHGYEYWFGEVVQKGIPTWLHGLLQVILGDLFYKLGYLSGSEIDLRIDPSCNHDPT
jgi:Uma2 family endonuclease